MNAIISCHGAKTNDYYNLPQNVNLHFYAPNGNILENDRAYSVLDRLLAGQTCDNYQQVIVGGCRIHDFNLWCGHFRLSPTGNYSNGVIVYPPVIVKNDMRRTSEVNPIRLSTIVGEIMREYPGAPQIDIHCLFCRTY